MIFRIPVIRTARPGLENIPINNPSWESYTAGYGQSPEESRARETRTNTPKWESSFPTTQ
jgi:hypothetical protein